MLFRSFSEVDVYQGRATAAYMAILNEQPGNRIALNNLAGAAMNAGMFERVREYGARYVSVDSSNFEAWPWAIWGAYGTGRTDEARAVRAAMRRRFTTPEEVSRLDQLDVQWLTLERDWPAVEKLARAQITKAKNPHAIEVLARTLALSLEMRGMLGQAWTVLDSLIAQRLAMGDTSAIRESRGQSARMRYFDRAWYGGDTNGIGRGIQTYITTSGVDKWRMVDRPFYNLLFDFTLAGDARGARARFAAYRAEVVKQKGVGTLPPLTSPVIRSLEGQVLLAEGKPREAMALLMTMVPESMHYPQPETFHVATAYLALGIRDSARLWFARVTDSQDPRRAWTESAFRVRALRQLCDLADTPVQKQQWCGALATELKDADPLLQPMVARARARMAE